MMIISKTPFRISFVGGGTDLPSYYTTGHGAVINAAIDKYIYIIIKDSFDGKIHLRTSETETEVVDNVNDLKHEITKACLKYYKISSGIELVAISDIPGGTGLGSSSCYTVGLLNALHAFKRAQNMPNNVINKNPITLLQAPSLMLAEDACRIEIEQLKAPIGKQDQYAAAYGGIHRFIFHPDGKVSADSMDYDLTLDYLNNHLMLFYIGGTRSANSILTEQNKNTSKNLNALNIMRDQVQILYNDITALPELLLNGWELKKSLASSISNPRIDNIYNTAIGNGAFSGKLLGAGGAGFMLFYCEPQYQSQVKTALASIGVNQIPILIGHSAGSEIIYHE